jgi:hypothetical protein
MKSETVSDLGLRGVLSAIATPTTAKPLPLGVDEKQLATYRAAKTVLEFLPREDLPWFVNNLHGAGHKNLANAIAEMLAPASYE